MLATDVTAKRLYDDCNLTIEEIAEALNLEVVVIKSILAQHSTKYRKAVRVEQAMPTVVVVNNEPHKSQEIDDNEYSEILNAYKGIAMDITQEPHIREKALRFLIELRKGLHEPRKEVAMNLATPATLNNLIREARERARAMIEDAQSGEQVVNV